MSKPKLGINIKIPDEILPELLTSSELRMLKNRWRILQLLEEGLSVRQIASQAKVGTDTVTRVSQLLQKNNFKQKINAGIAQKDAKSTWIFGQSS